jgi:cysteinyl-tRNA synthetase
MTPTRQPSDTPASPADGEASKKRVTLRLHNTLTRRKEDFAPIDPYAVRLYVCGPTVYDFAHIGNARPVIVFDVLFRLLRHLYGADNVTYVRNITDVDDKINARAERDYPTAPLNEAIAKVTSETERQFHEDVAALGCLPPDKEPRATQYIDTMRRMIERLIDRGVAYVAEDHVLFSPAAMNALRGAPRYGALARRSLDEMLAGARVDVAPYKRDPMDFVLWKPSKPNEPGWPSPAGINPLGRPGWHIECSAMSMATLIEPFGGGLESDDPSRNVFDIHGGGIDLVFPHHENEIAQSCCAFHSLRMANYWMHNGFLQVESEKMSKSLGNFVTIHELLHTTKFGGRQWSGEALRLAMLRTHYRQPIDWTVKALEEAEATLDRWYDAIGDVEPSLAVSDAVLDALNDDLNTPAALSELYPLGRVEGAANRWNRHREEAEGRRGDPGQPPQPFTSGLLRSARNDGDGSTNLQPAQAALLKTSANLMGLLLQTRSERFAAAMTAAHIDATRIEAIVAERVAARAARNWVESDRLRDELAALGVAIKDNKDGTTSWEPKR